MLRKLFPLFLLILALAPLTPCAQEQILQAEISLSAPVAPESPFTVSGVTVDITAASALDARAQAFEKAQQEAFTILAQRVGSPGAPPPPSAAISTLIQDYEITNEKLSAVRYIGTYTFRFRERAVRQYFGTITLAAPVPDPDAVQPLEGTTTAPAQVSQSGTLLILPFLQRGQAATIWSPFNSWMQAWSRAGTLDGLTLPMGDIQDVRDIGDSQALNYSEHGLDAMLARYGAQEAVLLVAVPGTAEGAPLSIQIYRTDRIGPEFVTSLEIPGGSMDHAISEVRTFLTGNWKAARSSAPAGQSVDFLVQVPLRTLKEWTLAQRALSRVQGVEDVVVRSLSPKGAELSLKFRGPPEGMATAFQQAGLNLRPPEAGGQIYTLYPGGSAPSYTQKF
ncbi:MAG: DUF2066 domain-containing protein [Alphaproteobacteria bacterium]|nr:DUF2066 domain-containing protein [Alphaproteobacteria bacterium]